MLLAGLLASLTSPVKMKESSKNQSSTALEKGRASVAFLLWGSGVGVGSDACFVLLPHSPVCASIYILSSI